jgi:hypothetical protein
MEADLRLTDYEVIPEGDAASECHHDRQPNVEKN